MFIHRPIITALTISLVSCHPAPAMAEKPSPMLGVAKGLNDGEILTFTNRRNTRNSGKYITVSPVTDPVDSGRKHPAATVASAPVAGYAGDTGPHGQASLAAWYTERTTAHSGFFVRVRSCPCYGGLDEGHPRMRRFSVPVCQPLYSPPPVNAWQLPVAVNPFITEKPIMANPARNPSEPRSRKTLISLTVLLCLQPGTRTGTTEIQQRLAERGLPVSLRTVQRHLIDLSAVLPIEADGERPQGWRWAKTPDAATLSRLVGGAA